METGAKLAQLIAVINAMIDANEGGELAHVALNIAREIEDGRERAEMSTKVPKRALKMVR